MEYVVFKCLLGSIIGENGIFVDVVYFFVNLKIVYLVVYLFDFVFDSKVMIGLLIVVLIFSWLFVEVFVYWIRFCWNMWYY